MGSMERACVSLEGTHVGRMELTGGQGSGDCGKELGNMWSRPQLSQINLRSLQAMAAGTFLTELRDLQVW